MPAQNENIKAMPGAQIYLVRSNLTAGTTGDTIFFSSANAMSTGKTANIQVEIINRDIRNRTEEHQENAGA